MLDKRQVDASQQGEHPTSAPIQPTVPDSSILQNQTQQPKKRIFIYLVLVLLVLLMWGFFSFIGGFPWLTDLMSIQTVPVETLQQATSEEQAGSTIANKIFESSKYKFRFEYPSNYTIRAFAGTQLAAEESGSFMLEGPYQNIEAQQGGPDVGILVEINKTKSEEIDTPEKIVIVKPIEDHYVSFTITSLVDPKKKVTRELFDEIITSFQYIYTKKSDIVTTQTYTNLDFNFSFQYPSNGVVYTLPEQNGLLGGADFGLKYYEYGWRPQTPGVYVWVFKRNGLSAKAWLEANTGSMDEGRQFVNVTYLGQKSIAGRDGIHFKEQTMFEFENVAIEKGDYIFVVGYWGQSDMSKIYDQILSTFNFIN